MPVAMISTSTSPAFGPSRSSSTISSGRFASNATAARVFIAVSPVLRAAAYEGRRVCSSGRLLADQITVDADEVDREQRDVLRSDPLGVFAEKTPEDERDRGGDEDHEAETGHPPAEIERDDERGQRSRSRAIPLQKRNGVCHRHQTHGFAPPFPRC